jgi:hypothetical protein
MRLLLHKSNSRNCAKTERSFSLSNGDCKRVFGAVLYIQRFGCATDNAMKKIHAIRDPSSAEENV